MDFSTISHKLAADENRFRTESDSMGPMQIPADAYYGAQTARAVENFPIQQFTLFTTIHSRAWLDQKYAAVANTSLDLLPKNISDAIKKPRKRSSKANWIRNSSWTFFRPVPALRRT